MSDINYRLPYQSPSNEYVDEIIDSSVHDGLLTDIEDFFLTEDLSSGESAEITLFDTGNEVLGEELPVILADIDEEVEETEPFDKLLAEQPQIDESLPEELQELTEITQIQPETDDALTVEEPPFEVVQVPLEQIQPTAQQESMPTQLPVQSQTPVQPQLPPPQIAPAVSPELLRSAEEVRPLEREAVNRNETPASVARFVEPQESPQSVQQNSGGGEIIFSRTAYATVGQIVEIPFRGTGWVYLGELASRHGITYDSRRLDADGQSFIFRAEEAGTYALKFFKQDFIKDYILNDHVQVIVEEAPNSGGTGWFNPPVDRGRVIAEPRWTSPLEEAELQRGAPIASVGEAPVDAPTSNVLPLANVQPSTGQSSATPPSSAVQSAPETVFQQGINDVSFSSDGIASLFAPTGSAGQMPAAVQPETVESTLPPELLLQKAKESFDAGNVSAAIALLDQYKGYYPSGNDELYWLYGQFYETNTPNRNILLSLDYYKRLVTEYPQSSRYNEARGRIAYLERFYIQIR